MAKGSKRKEGETPADAFKRLGSGRVSNVLNALRTLGHLAAKDTYEYTPQQIQRIMGDIRSELQRLERAFAEGKPAAKAGYQL